MSVNTAHGAFTVDGVHTEVLVSDYSNRLMVVVTQIGKLGTIYHAASRVSSSYRPISVLTSGGMSPSNTPPGPGSAAW